MIKKIVISRKKMRRKKVLSNSKITKKLRMDRCNNLKRTYKKKRRVDQKKKKRRAFLCRNLRN